MDGEKVIKSLCQSSVPSPSPSLLCSRGVWRRDTEWIDGWVGGVECVCRKRERETERVGEMDVFGQIFSLPFFTGKRGVADWLSKETC